MTINMDNVLGDFDNADPTATGSSGNKITVAGDHVVQIEEVRIKESEQWSGTVWLIVEFKVLESTVENINPDTTYSWAHNIMEKFFGQANAKAFLAAALGFDPASEEAKALGRKEMEEAWSEEQPLAGEVVKLTTLPKVTKSNFDFVVHKWEPASEGGE